jgi:hypothetical protein
LYLIYILKCKRKWYENFAWKLLNWFDYLINGYITPILHIFFLYIIVGSVNKYVLPNRQVKKEGNSNCLLNYSQSSMSYMELHIFKRVKLPWNLKISFNYIFILFCCFNRFFCFLIELSAVLCVHRVYWFCCFFCVFFEVY